MRLVAWFDGNARDLPWRRTCDPYGIWVSEIMLQQTQVKTVIPYWERWMRELPTIASLARASSAKIHKLWEGLGYYHRVRNMQRAAQIIERDHRGRFPTEFEEVLKLSGIGRYTAGAICSIAFGQPRPILDGNVARVLTRVFGIEGDPTEKETKTTLWALAEDLVREAVGEPELPREAPPCPAPPAPRAKAGSGVHRAMASQKSQASSASRIRALSQANVVSLASPYAASMFNQALMELGALVCSPREPQCAVCPLAKVCIAFRDSRVSELPARPARRSPTRRRFMAFVVQHGNQFLVRQRPAGEVNAHLWEFPNLEVGLDDGDPRGAARRLLGRAPLKLKPFCTVKHTITRYCITLEVFHAQAGPLQEIKLPGAHWARARLLDRLAFSSAHKKIVQRLSAD